MHLIQPALTGHTARYLRRYLHHHTTTSIASFTPSFERQTTESIAPFIPAFERQERPDLCPYFVKGASYMEEQKGNTFYFYKNMSNKRRATADIIGSIVASILGICPEPHTLVEFNTYLDNQPQKILATRSQDRGPHWESVYQIGAFTELFQDPDFKKHSIPNFSSTWVGSRLMQNMDIGPHNLPYLDENQLFDFDQRADILPLKQSHLGWFFIPESTDTFVPVPSLEKTLANMTHIQQHQTSIKTRLFHPELHDFINQCPGIDSDYAEQILLDTNANIDALTDTLYTLSQEPTLLTNITMIMRLSIGHTIPKETLSNQVPYFPNTPRYA